MNRICGPIDVMLQLQNHFKKSFGPEHVGLNVSTFYLGSSNVTQVIPNFNPDSIVLWKLTLLQWLSIKMESNSYWRQHGKKKLLNGKSKVILFKVIIKAEDPFARQLIELDINSINVQLYLTTYIFSNNCQIPSDRTS